MTFRCRERGHDVVDDPVHEPAAVPTLDEVRGERAHAIVFDSARSRYVRVTAPEPVNDTIVRAERLAAACGCNDSERHWHEAMRP